MSKDLRCFDERALCVGSLTSYIQWVNKVPLLSAEEEEDLVTRLRNYADLEAARKLVLSHLRLVVKIARGYAGYGLSQADLIQEGNIGLMKAVKRFDPAVGVRLVSFAIHWIRAEIHEFILRNWRIVKIATTKAQRKLFFNIRKFAKARGWFSNEEVQTVANMLNVSEKDVRQMEARLNNYDEAFDSYDSQDAEEPGSWSAPVHYLEDKNSCPEDQLSNSDWEDRRSSQLHTALAQLDERSQDILQKRWLSDKKATLHELAEKYGVSAERVRQLEKNAMNKIKSSLQDAA